MRTLYTGLTPPDKGFHCPLIKIVPRSKDDPAIQKMISYFSRCTHVIFTSGQAVRLFFELVPFQDKVFIAAGKGTAALIPAQVLTPEEETAEGIVELLRDLNLESASLLWPHSSLSRSVLVDFFKQCGLSYYDCVLYDTVSHRPESLPPLEEFDEIVFTSPSTVRGFLDAYGSIPKDKVLTPIGPVTAEALHKSLNGRQ